jgi:nucleoside-diphosphate-sugar epimerase
MASLIALTGGTGFVGGAVLRALLDRGIRVRALSRREGGIPNDRGIEIFYGDLAGESGFEGFLEGADAVVHIAGLIKARSREEFDRVNVEGTRRLVEAAMRRRRPPRFLYMSSLAAREPHVSDYAASKRAGERVVEEAAGLAHWQVLRPPAVYGPGDPVTRDLFRQFVRGRCPAPGKGGGRFSLIYVGDLAAAVVALVEKDGISNGRYELHDGKTEGYGWPELAEIAARVVGRPVRLLHFPRAVMTVAAVAAQSIARPFGAVPMLTPGKVREFCHEDWVARDNLLDEELDWRPRVTAEEGFANAIAWYKAHGWI